MAPATPKKIKKPLASIENHPRASTSQLPSKANETPGLVKNLNALQIYGNLGKDSVYAPCKPSSRVRRLPYSRQEQEEIVDYIINTKQYTSVKGIQLWQSMEQDRAVGKGKRTWQSMKEHFLKQIVPQLHIFDNVNDKAATRFKRALMGLPVDISSGDESSGEVSDPQEKTKSRKKKLGESCNREDECDEAHETDLSVSDHEEQTKQQDTELSVRKSTNGTTIKQTKDAKEVTADKEWHRRLKCDAANKKQRHEASAAGGDTTDVSEAEENRRQPSLPRDKILGNSGN